MYHVHFRPSLIQTIKDANGSSSDISGFDSGFWFAIWTVRKMSGQNSQNPSLESNSLFSSLKVGALSG